jgi:hypothetical protein
VIRKWELLRVEKLGLYHPSCGHVVILQFGWLGVRFVIFVVFGLFSGAVACRYGLREALAIVGERGLVALWKKHQEMHDRLWAGLKSLGLEPYVENPDDRLVTVNTIKVVGKPRALFVTLALFPGFCTPSVCV